MLGCAINAVAAEKPAMHDHNMMEMGVSNSGHPGDPAKVVRTIDVTMSDDMHFTPSSFEVKSGETIRFFVKNTGKMKHEMVIGDMKMIRAHVEMMKNMPDMQHNGAGMLSLLPGQKGALVWQFTNAGEVDFACTVPGHLEAGMTAKIMVK